MPLVQAKCTQCGANIEVDNKNEAAVCKYCGCAFIVEKAINNYVTNVVNNNNFAGATINVNNQANENNLCKLAVDSYNSGRYQEAYDYYTKTLEINKNNISAILGRGLSLARLSTITPNDYDVNFYMAFDGLKTIVDDSTLSGLIEDEQFIAFFDEIYNNIRDLTILANKCYVPRAMNTQNINVVLGALDVLYNSINFAVELLLETLSLETSDLSKKLNEILYRSCYLRIQVIDSLIAEREYCVAWGLRSGIGQVNKVRSPKYKEYLTIREKCIQDMKSTFPGRDIPKNVSLIGNDSGQIKSDMGCYIATCVYGSYDCPEVWVLRRYRDYKLATTKIGRMFIKIYYAISPKLVKWFGNTTWFKSIWRRRLNHLIVKCKKKGYKDLPYIDPKY